MVATTSLQIPPTEPGPSRHHQQQQGQYRPVSVAVQPTPASAVSPPASASRRQRASHTVQPTSRDESAGGGNGAPQSAYHDVYSHPAAVAYLAAHPRRTIPKFGPYLLLHTLGEGEFGKVKLGLHSLWGEEVAVKLIRRGNVDNTVRMSKVEREIEVLRTLKHPNIVRLYDVIETDKYIGIILEYASGGELFDHILAHRYLREGYASKLFFQLLSGVWYIHQKKIVHRDLKLENLLLDRHRNILITDFGFANRFEHRSDDLMQTSCGSPCYAAPELVISEGLYVGSAVDIWSCGVILYAMLAGYLPFDDDPANPDGDNINLLYKYIVNTPLTFPDYISEQARDLLSMMLVPDPKNRASLEAVMNHPWLADFHSQIPTDTDGMDTDMPRAFGKSVEDLERQAMEQHQMKRLAYQRQMRAAAANAQQQSAAPSPHGHGVRHGHHSYQPETLSAGPVSAGVVSPSSRRERTQPEYLYETSLDQSYASTASPGMPTPPTSAPAISSGVASAGRKGFVPTPVSVPMDEDDPFSLPSGPKSAGVVLTGATPAERERRPSVDGSPIPKTSAVVVQSPPRTEPPAKSQRHTVQVEYDESKSGRRSDDRTNTRKSDDKEKERERKRERKDRDRSASPRRATANGTGTGRSSSVSPKERREERGRDKQAAQAQMDAKPLPPSPSVPPSQPNAANDRPKVMEKPVVEVGERTPTKSVVKALNGSSTPTSGKAKAPGPVDPPVVSINVASPPGTPIAFASPTRQDVDDNSMEVEEIKEAKKKLSNDDKRETSSQHSKGSGHLRGLSAVGLGKIFGGSASSSPNGRTASENSDTASKRSGSRRPSTVQLPPSDAESKMSSTSSTGLSPSDASEKEGNGKEKDTKKSTRRNTLTVMVEPFSRSIRGKAKGRGASTPLPTPGPEVANKQMKDVNAPALPEKDLDRLNADGFIQVSQPDTSLDLGPGAMPASSSKAKKVMQWFRTKSKGGVDEPETSQEVSEKEPAERSRTPTQDSPYQKPSASSKTVNRDNAVAPPVPTETSKPPPSSHRHTLSPPSHPQRSASSGTSSPLMPSPFRWMRPSLTGNSASAAAAVAARSGTVVKNPNDAIRIHHGPVVNATITNMAPPEVMKLVRQVLQTMGVEFQAESEFKYRCVRGKKKKGAMSGSSSALGSVGPTSSGSTLAAVSISGSAASNGVDKRGLPVPSHGTFSGNMLKGLLMRRQSSQVSAPSIQNSTSYDDEVISPVGEPSSFVLPHQDGTPIYGDPSQDAGDEVRFSVELTRLDRLNDTYSLDIRRIRGNLRSYKFLHDIIRERTDLQR